MPAKWKRAPSRRYTSDDDDDDDYDGGNPSKGKGSGARLKPAQAVLQTQRMLEESGSGKHWGTVYSLSGERIGVSYVGNNLRGVTVQTVGLSPAPATDHLPSQRKRVYIGRWQDSWGPPPETSDDPDSEGERRTSKRSGSKRGLGRVRSHYVGDQNVIKAWRFNAAKIPHVAPFPPLDSFDTHASPSNPLPFSKPCDPHEAADDNQIDEEGEDDDRGFWIMEDGSSPPKKTDLPLIAAMNIPGLNNINNFLNVRSTAIREPCGQLVPQEDLAGVVASSLQAAGTTVLFPHPPLPLSTFS
jgi:hypothetical protein